MKKNKFNQDSNSELYNLYQDYEKNFKTLKINEMYEGKIAFVSDKSIGVDVGARDCVWVDVKKEKNIIDVFNLGDDINVFVTKQEKETTFGSIEKCKEITTMKNIYNLKDKREAVYCVVKSLNIGAGFIVDIMGIECFMPGSLAGVNKIHNFESLIGKTLPVFVINFTKNKIVVSHKDYLESLIPSEKSKLKKGFSYKGKITGVKNGNIFVEFNTCLTGMIHASEVNEEWMAKINSQKDLNEQPITIYLKDISNNKIALTTKKPEKIEQKKQPKNTNQK